MRRSGQLVFLCAFAASLALYALTAPRGLPWNGSTHLALAYLGEIVRLPVMPHPVWGFHVQVFCGAVALSVFMAALAAGLLAVVVNRYVGWRFAVGAALAWTFFPGVWNRAITGERSVCLAAMAVVAAWALNAVMLRVLRKARDVRRPGDGRGKGGGAAPDEQTRYGRWFRFVGWLQLGVAAAFALGSLAVHDYRLGEAAGAFARGVVDAADGRIIVMNGVCDDQIVRAAKRPAGFPAVALRNDEAYHTNLIAWVQSTFPRETNLWIEARVGAAAFAEAAATAHPDRFYLMDGRSATAEQWERRWNDFKPYLASEDPFVRVARRMFGHEGNAVANAICDGAEGVENRRRCRDATVRSTPAPDACASSAARAWQMYRRIYAEIDPGNFSALVNMSEMIRRGHAVSGDERKSVQDRLEAFLRDAGNRERLREIVRAAGPVRADLALAAKASAEAKKRIAAKVAAGERVEFAPEILTLVEWNNEMVGLMDRGELVRAGRIARAILTHPKWRGFLPANAVMGSVAAHEGDYVASEAFFRVATDTTNAVPALALNDYADTLLHLDRTEAAEKTARRAVGESDEKVWVARLTLAEVLEKKLKAGEEPEGRDGSAGSALRTEIRTLLKSVLKHAPAPVRERIRKERQGFIR